MALSQIIEPKEGVKWPTWHPHTYQSLHIDPEEIIGKQMAHILNFSDFTFFFFINLVLQIVVQRF